MGKTVLGSTIEPLAVLPKANRVDTQVSIVVIFVVLVQKYINVLKYFFLECSKLENELKMDQAKEFVKY